MSEEHWPKAKAGLITIFWIFSMTLTALVITTIKYFRTYKLANRWMAAFFVMLILSLLARMVSTAENIYYIYYQGWISSDPLAVNIIMTFLSLPFLSSAVTFHTFNGIYNIFNANELIYNKTYKRIFVDIALVLSIWVWTVPYLYIFIYFAINDQAYGKAYEWLPDFRNFIFIKFTLIAVAFWLVSYLFLMRLK